MTAPLPTSELASSVAGQSFAPVLGSGFRSYYSDALCTIYHADCIDVLPTLAPCDLLLTDPPYGVTYQSNHRVGQGSTPITNDGTRLSLALYRQVLPLVKANHLLWFTRWDAWPDVWAILGQYYPLRGLLVWDKGHNGMGDLNHWGLSYELIASAGGAKLQGARDGSVLRYKPKPSNDRHHPTEKPVGLLAYLMEKVNAKTVCDPFMGSGTTLVAAKQMGRKCVGIETNESYCEIAAKRLAQDVMTLGSQNDQGMP